MRIQMDIMINKNAQLHYIYYQCYPIHITLYFIMVLYHLDMEKMF